MRIAIHTQSTHEHVHLHHHILWALFVLMILLLLFSRPVAGRTLVGATKAVAYFGSV